MLDGLCLPAFDFVKLDIEGSEAHVLLEGGSPEGGASSRGSSLAWLASVRYVYVETHDDFVSGARNTSARAMRAAGMQVVGVRLRHEKILLGCSRRFEHGHCMVRCQQWAEYQRAANHGAITCTAWLE